MIHVVMIAGNRNTCLQSYFCYGWWESMGTTKIWSSS